jgi:VanZ family protein
LTLSSVAVAGPIVQTIFARRLTSQERSPCHWTDQDVPGGNLAETGRICLVGVRILPFVVAVLLSVIVLFTPESGVPTAPPGTDKVVHFLLFALLMGAGRFARLPVRALLLSLIGYAAVSEVLQWLITVLGRSGDVLDALVDVAGIGFGYGLAHLVARSASRRRQTPPRG